MEDRDRDWRRSLRRRRDRTVALGRLLHRRYSRLFWTLHSTWALISGGIVLVLAHNRYGFLPWVVVFLTLTWASTLFFSRFAAPAGSDHLRFARGFVSYLTRVMYQETLFFLLPFYFYSTTFPSWNSAYVVILAALAVLSCFDAFFGQLLLTNRWFALAFFAFVTYSALQFFLPLVLHVPIHNGAYLAAGVSFFASLPLAYSAADLKQPRRKILIFVALIGVVAVLKVGRALIPPVPLRLAAISFATGIDPATLRLEHEFPEHDVVPASRLREGHLIVRATIFSPGRLPVRIQIRLARDGIVLRNSRTLNLVAHSRGFRVWDALRIGANGLVPGRYRAEVWTGEGQLVGRGEIRVVPDAGGADRFRTSARP